MPPAPNRGSGRPVGVHVIERAVDEAARLTGLDRVEIRRRNFVPADAFPYRTAFGIAYDSGNYARALERVVELADYHGHDPMVLEWLRVDQKDAWYRLGLKPDPDFESIGGAAQESRGARTTATGPAKRRRTR